METEITIFEIPEKEISTNKSQRELDYEVLQKNSKLDGFHFSNFYDMELFTEKIQRPQSNITSVLCKWVIQYCMPVIHKDDLTKSESKTGVQTSVQTKNVQTGVQTGVQTEDKVVSNEPFTISIQNETPIYAFCISDGTYRIIESDKQFNIRGLKIPDMFVRCYDKHMLSYIDHLDSITLANSGNYGLIDLQTLRYTQQREELVHMGPPYISSDKSSDKSSADTSNIVLFTSVEDAMQKIRKLIDYIVFLEYYYGSNLLTLLNSFKISPYAPEFSNTGDEPFKVKRVNTKDTSILSELNNVQHGNFGESFNTDIMLTLESNKLTYAYNMGNIIGTSDELFKKIINDRKQLLEDDNDYKQQLNEGFAKKLEIAKKQTIAYNKYHTDDLDSLDKKQLEVVNLEHSKMEKFLHKDLSSNAKQMQKLWYHLRNSFSDISSERLRESLAAIKKEVSKQDLESYKLLDGGVCPHVVAYGEEMLKNFGKPWLNTELREFIISKYSLPKDTSGHFCKICGEFIADADNEDIVRFIGGERVVNLPQDDPLQTMIWKEAMYIITTYIKFNTPIPLKPLVNSLANGLRGIIGDEEAKLYKSKTNTQDIIKDTLNLYTAIYIYAALCALMINNPNKMIFGKDKPDSNTRDNRESRGSVGAVAAGEKSYSSPYLVNKSRSKLGGNLNSNLDDKLDSMFDDNSNSDSNSDSDDDKTDIEPVAETDVEHKSRHDHKSTKHKHQDKHQHKRHSFKYKHGGKTTKDIKLYERFVLTTALNLIVLTKDATIKRIKTMNIDVVKQIFLKNAYTWAKVHAKPIKVSDAVSTYAPRIQTVISTDPFYLYLYYARRLAYNSKGVSKDSQQKHTPPHLDNIKDMLGRDSDALDEDIKKDVGIYETAKIPSKWEFGDKLYDEYTYLSFISTLEYITNRIFQKDFVPRNVLVTEYYEKFKDLSTMEKQIIYRIAKQKVRPLFQIEWLNDIRGKYNDFRPEKIDLAQHYCPTGEKHKVGFYIYKDLNGKDGKDVELTRNTIVDWLKNADMEALKKYDKMHLINERCELCKNTIRDAKSSERSDKTFSNMFKRIDDLLAFFQYYDTRCPKGDLHDIVDNICKKCELNTEFKKKLDTKYYEKYVNQFKKIEREKQLISIESLKQAQEGIKDGNLTNSNKNSNISEYKTSLQKIAEWSQISGVKYNMLINLGLTEGYKYVDIENAQVNPNKQLDDDPNNEGMYKTQALKLKNYIYQVIREYNTLLNHENIVELPIDLKEILDVQRKIDISKLDTSMPDINHDFIKIDRYYKYTLSSKEYANFLLEHLAGIMVLIHKQSADKYKTMAKMLVNYFTKSIIDQEKLFSKAESILAKMNASITTVENDSDDEDDAVSGDEVATGYQTDHSATEFVDDEIAAKNETYENDIDNEGFDVENANDVWENE